MLKKISFAAVLLLAACQVSGTDTVSGQLTTPADFAQITGKKLNLNENDFAVLNADGTLTGTFSGADTRGTWTVKDGFWCRELTAGPRGPSPEDCQIWSLDGNVVSVRRNRGEGAAFQYTMS